MEECWYCGDTAHNTREHYQWRDQIVPSLAGAKLGRRAGFRTVQSKVGQLIMDSDHAFKSLDEQLKFFHAIMDLRDDEK